MKEKNKCSQYIIDKKTKQFRKCSNCYYIILNKKKLCWPHFNKQYNKYCIIIQKIYRGYKCRRIYKNIFIKLPIDLQYKIINYNRSDIYYKKYCNTIYKLIRKRYIICRSLDILNYKIINYSDIEFINNFDIIYNAYYLYSKYFDLIYNKCANYNKYNYKYNYKYDMNRELQYLYLNIDNLIKKLKNLSQNYFYEISDNIEINYNLLNIYNRLNMCTNFVISLKYKYSDYCNYIEGYN